MEATGDPRTDVRVCCHPHLGFSPHGSDPTGIADQIADEITGQRLNFGSHFRLASRKTKKKNEFCSGSNIRIRGGVNKKSSGR